jgi:hypothetical protein
MENVLESKVELLKNLLDDKPFVNTKGWNKGEISDLEKIEASYIKGNTALLEEDDLVVFLTKIDGGYKIDTNKDIKTFRYGLKPNLSGGERTPDVSDIDYSKKIPENLHLPINRKNWIDVLIIVDVIFRKYKFGWDYDN